MARVTVLGLPATWGDPPSALARVEAELDRAPPGDIVLLPEQALVGYVSPRADFDLAPFAEAIDGPTARAACALAVRRKLHLVAPLVLRTDEGVANAMVVASPDGAIVATYEKRHPWVPERWARRGRRPHPRIRIADVSVTIAICYDLHFLPYEAETRETLRAVDLVLFPSAWVDTEDSRMPLLRDLARTFGVAVANANWSEGVVRVPGQGSSCILDARGAPLAIAGDGVVRIDADVAPRTSPHGT